MAVCEKKKKWLDMVPQQVGRGAHALERVLGVPSPCAAVGLKSKVRHPLFVPKTTGYTPISSTNVR